MEITHSQLISLLHFQPSGERQQGWNDAIVRLLKMIDTKEEQTSFAMAFLESAGSGGIDPESAREIALSCLTGNKLMAVKMLKDKTGLGLKEAKNVIDDFCPLAEAENLQETMKGAIAGKKFGF